MKWMAILWCSLLLGAICYFFWKEEVKYSLPTPVPNNLKNMKAGDAVAISDLVETNAGRPLLLHFFNPDCPCSRFNLPHVRSIVKNYSDRVDVAVVIMDAEKKYSAADMKEKIGHNISVFFDTRIAERCGVYATPQAVILDADKKIYYKGNYNKSRYCTNKKSDFARIALDSLLNRAPVPGFEKDALVAYGCELPVCTGN